MRTPGDGRGWIQSALVAALGERKLDLGVELKKVLLHTAAWRDSETGVKIMAGHLAS